MFHYYDNFPAHYGSQLASADTLDNWLGLSVIYLRIPWSYIEPAEGRYNWSVLDTPAQRWIAKGKQVAFRISCYESWTRRATPQWVADVGAKGYNFRPGAGVQADGPFWEPDYDDPVFLTKLDRFLAAMAGRYDGNPEVAFVDIGSLGVWGEGHTWASTKRPILPETVKRPGGRTGQSGDAPTQGDIRSAVSTPTRQGARNHEERLLPDAGEAERRVMVGRLQVNASGQPTLEVAQ